MVILSRTLASLKLAGVALLCVNVVATHALAQSLATDPLVQQEINPSNWEPGGKHYPNNFNTRGDIIDRSGGVGLTVTSSIRAGNIRIQQGQINGTIGYTIDLDEHHPYEVHAPFDLGVSASDSANVSTETRQVDINLQWQGSLIHPAEGYDPPTGGGYPAPDPRGAIDVYSFGITGTANGQFLIPQSEIQALDRPPSASNSPHVTSTGSTARITTRTLTPIKPLPVRETRDGFINALAVSQPEIAGVRPKPAFTPKEKQAPSPNNTPLLASFSGNAANPIPSSPQFSNRAAMQRGGDTGNNDSGVLAGITSGYDAADQFVQDTNQGITNVLEGTAHDCAYRGDLSCEIGAAFIAGTYSIFAIEDLSWDSIVTFAAKPVKAAKGWAKAVGGKKTDKLEDIASDLEEFLGKNPKIVRSDDGGFVVIGKDGNKFRIDKDGHGYDPHAHLEVKGSGGKYKDADGTPHHIYFDGE